MDATKVSRPPVRRSFLRVWFPALLAALVGLAIAGILAWPNDEWELASRNASVQMIAMVGTLLILVWFFFLSGLPWRVRLGGLAVLAVAGASVVASVERVKFTGDMLPILTFRWERSRDDILEEHRRRQATEHLVASVEPVRESEPDFPEYRGRNRDGVVSGPALARDWQAHPPKQLRRHPIGGGYSGFAVVGKAAVTLEQRRDQEAVVCYDAATGIQRWAFAYDGHFSEFLGGDGPRATPTIKDGQVYSLGATGVLVCLELATGKKIWSVKILDDTDNVRWGMSGSPLVYDNAVVVNPGVQGKRESGQGLVAYDRRSGDFKWGGSDKPAGYSSPMVVNLASRRQVLLLDGDQVAGYDAEDGKKLWSRPWQTQYGINVAQPVVLDDDRVFVSAGYGVGGAMLKIQGSKGEFQAESKWSNKHMRCKFTSPILFRSHLYGLDEGVLVCLDAETGERKWKGERYGHGQLLLAGDLLVVQSEKPAKLVLVEARPDVFRELGSIRVFDDKTWNPFAIADGKAYLRNDQEMACYDLTERT